jgi:hypothetical protein
MSKELGATIIGLVWGAGFLVTVAYIVFVHWRAEGGLERFKERYVRLRSWTGRRLLIIGSTFLGAVEAYEKLARPSTPHHAAGRRADRSRPLAVRGVRGVWRAARGRRGRRAAQKAEPALAMAT